MQKATANTSLNFKTNMLSHQTTGTLLRAKKQQNVVVAISNGKIRKTTEIKYLANASKGLDVGYDAGYFDGGQSKLGLYTKLADGSHNSTNFMLQCVSDVEGTVIPLGVKTEATTEVTFSVNASNLPNGVHVLLEDRATGIVTNLSNGNEYTVNASAGTGRFYLHTKKANALNVSDIALSGVNIYYQNETLKVEGLKGAATLKMYNLLGKEVFNTDIRGVKNNISIPKISRGVYIIQVNNNNGFINKKVIIE